jgi:phosphoribosyl 1,2-cyclic phosphodiesterase
MGRSMTLRFTMLASGSSGNSCLVQSGQFGVLIDAGLGPRQLAERLTMARLSLSNIDAVILTHTHADHWNDRILSMLHRLGIPLWCHPGHHALLSKYSSNFATLQDAGLIQSFSPIEPFELPGGIRCIPLPVSHDSDPTFGFRLDGPADLFGRRTAIGYAADLGCWDDLLIEAFANVDLLALEFNHDVAMEHQSKRPAYLVARVLGDQGHLSNEQAADFVRVILDRSSPGRLQHIVQLHLSSDCNKPLIARRAALTAISQCPHPPRIHTAAQDVPGKSLLVEPGLSLLMPQTAQA